MTLYGQKNTAQGTQANMTARKPGRPRRKGPTKIPLTIRLDMDLLNALKLSGPGWQTRVNHVVRNWILEEGREDCQNQGPVNPNKIPES